jgi:hypothetical protein
LAYEVYLPSNICLDASERIEGIRNEGTGLGEVVKGGTLRDAGSIVPSIGRAVLKRRRLADMGKEDISVR